MEPWLPVDDEYDIPLMDLDKQLLKLFFVLDSSSEKLNK